jgi:uncharacterized protein
VADTPSRIATLDLLRGVAILGTLGTNIWIFTDPEGLVGYLDGTRSSTTIWHGIETVLQQAAQGKFLGLLTIMFGIGLEIQRRSALRHGQRWPGGYPVRAALLLLDGVVHYLLVVEFDVLMGYAVTGLVVAYLIATSEAAQRRWMIAAGTVHVALLTALTALLLTPMASTSRGPLDPNPYADGSWWDLVVFRAENAALFRAEVVFILPLSIATFLAGARLFRAGVFEARGRRLRRRLMAVGLGVALPLDFALGLLGGDAGLVVGRYGTAPVVAAGLLALVVEAAARRPPSGQISRSLTAVGRTALSSYVLQNLVASVLCYGWGLGLAARLGDARVPGTVVIYAVVCVVVAVAARWWLARFERGPVEWLWRRSYDAVQSLLPRRGTTNSAASDAGSRHPAADER